MLRAILSSGLLARAFGAVSLSIKGAGLSILGQGTIFRIPRTATAMRYLPLMPLAVKFDGRLKLLPATPITTAALVVYTGRLAPSKTARTWISLLRPYCFGRSM